MTTKLTARSPEDVLAAVPVILGFEPHDSIVMLTFSGEHCFHARIDLPPGDHLDAVVGALLAPARQQRVGRALFVLYSPDEVLARQAARALSSSFRGAGIEVVDVLRAAGGRWYRPLGGRGTPRHGVAYDVSSHPFVLQAVVEGRVLAGSREELAARVAGDQLAADRVEDRLEELVEAEQGGGEPVGLSVEALRTLVDAHVLTGAPVDDTDAARILVSVRDAASRDHVWMGVRREEAEAHARFWTDLVRRAPTGLVAGAAGVLAFCAWMAGHGALAWCALDRCFDDDVEGDHGAQSLGRLVADLLERAVAPREDIWERLAEFRGGATG